MIAGPGIGDAPKVDCAWLAIDVMIACAICGARVVSWAEWPVVNATGNTPRMATIAMAITPSAITTSARVKPSQRRLIDFRECSRWSSSEVFARKVLWLQHQL